jgi:hypothetical protein
LKLAGELMSNQKPQKRLVIRWATLKGLSAIILFLVIAALAEYLVVIYAVNLGVKDVTQLQWTFKFPGTGWALTLVVSPLFHLVPLGVIISLVFSWICLTKHAAVKPVKTQKEKAESIKRGQKQKFGALKKFGDKIKSGLLKIKSIAYVWQEIHFARATIKSASMILLVFLALIVVASLLTYPRMIYQAITGTYKNDPSLLNSVKGTAQFFASVGGIFSFINNGLLAAAPGFRDFVVALGSVTAPLANLDNAGKYLVFQNVAAWVSGLATLFYGEYRRKSYRYKKARRS